MCADLRSVTINPFRNRLPGFFGAAALGLLIFAHYGIDDLTLQDWATPQNGRTTPATASAGSAVPPATLTATTLATTSRYVSGNPLPRHCRAPSPHRVNGPTRHRRARRLSAARRQCRH